MYLSVNTESLHIFFISTIWRPPASTEKNLISMDSAKNKIYNNESIVIQLIGCNKAAKI